jgi:hypothetical protein
VKGLLLCGVALVAVAASTNSSQASDVLGKSSATGEACDPWVDYDCVLPKLKHKPAQCDPYLDYSCLDTYLGSNFFERWARYYVLEWGKGVAPPDPKAPAGGRPAARRNRSPNGLMAARTTSPRACPMRLTAR